MPSEALSEMGYALTLKDMDPAVFARQWVDENEDVVLGWLTQ